MYLLLQLIVIITQNSIDIHVTILASKIALLCKQPKTYYPQWMYNMNDLLAHYIYASTRADSGTLIIWIYYDIEQHASVGDYNINIGSNLTPCYKYRCMYYGPWHACRSLVCIVIVEVALGHDRSQ